MGALPKQRISRAHQGNRRRHHFIAAPTLVPCKECGEMKQAHHVCPSCGRYRGRQVVQIETRQRAAE
ncbi:MAG: 50S ribosomal protein L32 [Thermomicrobiales bacterium]|nr:50S ribosomal protein L32 [Thermomicrobiales bacterium]MCO5217650.1 50S ribosomal protein L32 [Thermomicrobiales bacterium]MCO5224047.1 50S ribosomal protein L32 [Thermomicrobiales bacterium]MCO5228159.1 50S ribosomal protein L32 [Thermomicrobiales bacterium]